MNDEQGLGLKRKRVLQNVSPVSRQLIKFCKSFLYSLKTLAWLRCFTLWKCTR